MASTAISTRKTLGGFFLLYIGVKLYGQPLVKHNVGVSYGVDAAVVEGSSGRGIYISCK